MNLMLIVLNNEISNTRDLILGTEEAIQAEKKRREFGKSLCNIEELKNVKKTYEHNYNKLLAVKHLVFRNAYSRRY